MSSIQGDDGSHSAMNGNPPVFGAWGDSGLAPSTTQSVCGVLGSSQLGSGVWGITYSTQLSVSGVLGNGQVGVAGKVTGANTSPAAKVGVYGTGSSGSNLGGIGVQGVSDSATGVLGQSTSATGVLGQSTSGDGVAGTTSSSVLSVAGIRGTGLVGVAGIVAGATAAPAQMTGVFGSGSNGSNLGGIGVRGISDTVDGVFGESTSGNGVHGKSSSAQGVYGESSSGFGLQGQSSSTWAIVGTGAHGVYGVASGGGVGTYGYSPSGFGAYGSSSSGYGVYGTSSSSYGVYGSSYNNNGVYGNSTSGSGVQGHSDSGAGVYASSGTGSGVMAEAVKQCAIYGHSVDAAGLIGISDNSYGVAGFAGKNSIAGYFVGDLYCTGSLSKGGGGFKIDHVLDPENKFLNHSFVESPDMKNVYDGVVTLDDKGEAVVALPDWFEALNRDFRYLLTPIGAAAPNLYVASEIQKSSFKIAGGSKGLKVSWQLTGIRQDPWAQKNRLQVEEPKKSSERGLLLHAAEVGKGNLQSISGARFMKAAQAIQTRALEQPAVSPPAAPLPLDISISAPSLSNVSIGAPKRPDK